MYQYAKQSIRARIRNMKCSLFDCGIMCLYNQLSMPDRYFKFDSQTYKYAARLYNSERTIEVPIVMCEVDKCTKQSGSILEVGNVLNWHQPFKHTVVDKYEIANGVINEDIVTFNSDTKYDLIVMISTLEHVGYDEPILDNRKILTTLDKLRTLSKPGGKIVITVPLGYNKYLDDYIKQGYITADQMHLMHRISKNGRWCEVPFLLCMESATPYITYNSPYPFANWVLVMVINVK